MARHRSEMQILQDRADIASCLRKGYRSSTQIASYLNSDRDVEAISPSAVSLEIRSIKDQLVRITLDDYTVARKEQIDRLFHLMTIAHEGYELSKRPKVTIESESVVDAEQYIDLKTNGLMGSAIADEAFIRAAKIREESRPEGNHAFIQQIIQIEEKIAKRLGIDDPSRVPAVEDRGQTDSGSPLDDLLSKLSLMAPAATVDDAPSPSAVKELPDGT